MLEVIEGRREGEAAPDLIVAVVDATNLRMNLRLVLELKRLGRPMLVALNMADVARSQGLTIDVGTAGPRARLPGRGNGGGASTTAMRSCSRTRARRSAPAAAAAPCAWRGRWPGSGSRTPAPIAGARCAASSPSWRPAAAQFQRFQHRIDAVVMHPVWGLALLAARAVPDLPGGVLVGRSADGPHQGCDGRTRPSGPPRTWPTARCAACSSTA